MNIFTYYDITFIASLVLSIIYVWRWHRHFNIHINMIFILIPITILGYIQFSRSVNLEEALLANKIIYLGGCFLLPFITLAVLDLCNINVKKWVRLGFFVLSSIVYIIILSTGRSDVFYSHVEFELVNNSASLIKEYGILHPVFYIMVIIYLLINIIGLYIGYYHRKDVSRKIVTLLFFTEFISIFCYFFERIIKLGFDLEPLTYNIAQIVYLIIIKKLNLYNISDTVIDSLIQKGNVGFASFDFGYNYLGSNETARTIFPELSDLRVDTDIRNNEVLKNSIYLWLEECNRSRKPSDTYYEKDDSIYKVDINYLHDGLRKRGYQLFITDDTKNQRFNQQLQKAVKEKTEHIEEMNDAFIMGMATMVESRDNSTGGHIKRTSEGVRILTDQIRKDNRLNLSAEFISDLIKAAPMHDLGKIAVDDAILRKPGKFTPEEFEQMKKHAAEGARIVSIVLESIDDEKFKKIAENVAHYHHERVDGSGYPEGLKGNEIPMEAKIMAIADVYDALVSKRVYKDKMSFEQADKIIMEGMGKQFDKILEPYYVAARSELEAYYSKQQ